MSPDLLADRYELTERIAGGGMGQVWRGRDRILERIVAVKTVDLSSQDQTLRERFRREAIATAGLSAPNIVQVYDAGVDGNTAFLVMELLTGPSLSQMIHDHGPMDLNQGIHVSREVARALLAAHRIGVVHRDIKPGNVMYHHDQVKLVDFGIAQLARNMGATLTAPATALGTATYMSPEQATGEGATDKSDWYALGCLMMTIFTGEPPFTGDPISVATQQINARPPYLSERRPEVPMSLDRLVAALLAKEPVDRPKGEEIVEQLRLLGVDPDAGTVLMSTPPPAATGSATAILPSGGMSAVSGASPARSRASFTETAAAPPARPPARAAAPLPPEQWTAEEKRRRSPYLLVLGALLLVLLIIGGLLLVGGLLQGRQTPPPVAPAAPPSLAPTTTTQPATTRPPTTPSRTPTRRPTSAKPSTTRPSTTQTPSSEPTQTSTNGSDDSTNSGPTPVQNSISEVENPIAQQILQAAWAEAALTGDTTRFVEVSQELERQGLLTAAERRTLSSAARSEQRG